MNLLATLFRPVDIFFVPLCFVLLLMAFSVVIRKHKDERIKRLFLQAFYFKMVCAVIFTVLTIYVFGGGDSEMYYECTEALHKAVMDDGGNFWKIYTTKVINAKTPLMNYFIFSESRYPIWEAMHGAGNFMVPKLALPAALVFSNSYTSMAMVFSFFALGGAIRLFKFFYYYFPQYFREIALATLFLPSIAFWSSGLLKDSICFGAVGYLVYAVFNIFIRRRKIISSLAWILVAVVLLFYIKVYILLSIAPAIVLWLFREFNKVVENKTLRNIMAILTFAIGGILAIVLINYVTSDESMRAFRLDALMETSEHSRTLYEGFGSKYEGSYYSIGSSNPVLLVPLGIVATLFRPFLWEANNATALLSALEALFFLYLTVYLMYKKGIGKFFKNIFNQPLMLLCFLFSMVFAAAIGSTALNFGSLSRYKIPCLPFYLFMVLILWQQAGLQYPRWFKKLLGYNTLPPWIRKTAI